MVTAAAGVATAITTITMMINRSGRKKVAASGALLWDRGPQPRQEVTGTEEGTLSRIQSRSLCPLGWTLVMHTVLH